MENLENMKKNKLIFFSFITLILLLSANSAVADEDDEEDEEEGEFEILDLIVLILLAGVILLTVVIAFKRNELYKYIPGFSTLWVAFLNEFLADNITEQPYELIGYIFIFATAILLLGATIMDYLNSQHKEKGLIKENADTKLNEGRIK